MGSTVLAQKSVYERLTQDFDWGIAELELGYQPGSPLNIGWMCSDRLCHLGLSSKPALIWEDFQGAQKRFTYDDVRILSNTIAAFLVDLGIHPGERVCLFLDRIPELYIGFLGILKTGAVAQPLFSAFGRPRPSSPRRSTCPRCARSAAVCPICVT
jgi:acetyl-CoA synthetase